MHTQGNDVRGARDRLPLSSIPDCDPATEQLLYVAQARALLQNDQLDLALHTAKQAFEQQRTQELQQVWSRLLLASSPVLRTVKQAHKGLPETRSQAYAQHAEHACLLHS